MSTETFGFCQRLLSISDKILQAEIPKSKIYVSHKKHLRKCVSLFVKLFFYTGLRKLLSKSWHFYKKKKSVVVKENCFYSYIHISTMVFNYTPIKIF